MLLPNLNLKNKNTHKDDHIVLFDTMNTLIRSFSANPEISHKGVHVGGLTGTLRSVGHTLRELNPSRVVFVWEGSQSAEKRRGILKEYKTNRHTSGSFNSHNGLFANREESKQSLIKQAKRLKDYLGLLPVHQLQLKEYEADDIIAFISKHKSKEGKKVTVVSTDKDYLQLIDKNISVYQPIKKILIDHKNITKHISVPSQNYSVLKTLTGDKSDGVKGLHRVGEKTAIKFFPLLAESKKYTLDDMFNHAVDNIEEHNIFAKVVMEQDRLIKNFKVMDLHKTLLTETHTEDILTSLETPVRKLNETGIHMLMQADNLEKFIDQLAHWIYPFKILIR